MYNKESTDRGNSSVPGFSSTSIYNNYEYNIRTGNRTSLNDLVKHNAILRHMPMFDHQNNVKNVFVTSLPTTVTIKKASIRRIRKKIYNDKKNEKVKELKIFDKEPKKQDITLKLPVEEKKIKFSALLNNSLSNMGYLKSHDYSSREIRKLQPHTKKINTSDIQRFGVYFNEASIPSLINVDNDITQYEDTNKITSTTMKATTIPRDVIIEYQEKEENKNLSRGTPNLIDASASNLPFSVTEAFEKEFDLFTTKEQSSEVDKEVKNKSSLISTRTILPPLEDKPSKTTTVNSRLRIVRPTKESRQLEVLKAEDDRDSYKMLTYSKVSQQPITFVTKSLINGIEENSVKKVISGSNNIITLPNILLPSLNDNDNNNNNKIERVENTHEANFIDDNHVTSYNKNYAFGSLIQPIMQQNYLYKKENFEKPYIFDIPPPVKLPTSKLLSLFPPKIVNDPKIQEKIINLKNLESNKNMIVGQNLLNYYPNNFIYLSRKRNEEIKKRYGTPIQFGNVIIERGKSSSLEKSYNEENYHSKIVLKCFKIKEDFYINTLKNKERRINVSEKECAMFCASHLECSVVAFHRKLKLCDLYAIEENKESKKHLVLGGEKYLIQKYGIPFNGINLLIPLREGDGFVECIRKIYSEEKSTSNEDGIVIDSEELEFMDSKIGESKMKEEEDEGNEIKRKALGSTMFIVKSKDKHISEKMLENWENTSNTEKLMKFLNTIPLYNNDTYNKSFPVHISCPNGEKHYYIKSEKYKLKENLSKSTIQRSSLKECEKACNENLSLGGLNIICSSFSYNFVKKECLLHEKGSDFEGNNHLIENDNYNNYESICLDESLVDMCEIVNKYPIRKKQTILIGYAIDSFRLPNVKECINKCLVNEDCQSITYFYDNEEDNCILNSEHSKTDVNSFITVQTSNTVDFFSLLNCQKNFLKNKMGVI